MGARRQVVRNKSHGIHITAASGSIDENEIKAFPLAHLSPVLSCHAMGAREARRDMRRAQVNAQRKHAAAALPLWA